MEPASILSSAVPAVSPPPSPPAYEPVGNCDVHRPTLRLRVLDGRRLLLVVFAVSSEMESDREYVVRFFRRRHTWTCNCRAYHSRRQACEHSAGVQALADSIGGVQNILRLAGEAGASGVRP